MYLTFYVLNYFVISNIITMSRIKKLSVSGIRNFDESELSTIRFTLPLTLILGPNGTGKTTIIESLKFATTGDFPPGSEKGKAFVHDLQITGSFSVKGIVKCEFCDSVRNTYTVCRSMMCTHTGSSSKFQRLHDTLTRKERGTTNIVSVSSRCIDTEVTSAMGVSKAILNYVIFCHQEDFSWPLDDGKKLKEKFDDIFDSARFNKALDNLLKQSKEMEQELKVLKAQKQALNVIIEEVEEKEAKLENTKNRLEDVKNDINTINAQLEPITQQLRVLDKLDTEYRSLMNEKDKKKMESEVIKEQITKLKHNIHEVHKGSITELLARVELYDESLSKRANEISKLEESLKQIAVDEVKLTKVLNEKKILVGALSQQIQDQEKRIASRNKIFNEALSIWNKEQVDSNMTNAEINDFVKEFEKKLKDLKHTIEINKTQRQNDERELQKNIDELRTERSKIESEINLKKQEIEEIKKGTSKLRFQISQTNVAASKLNSLEMELQNANKKINELCTSLNTDAVKAEIEEEIQSRNAKEALLSKVEEEIECLHKQTALQTELDLHKSALCYKQQELNSLVKKHSETLQIILEVSDVPRTKLKDKIDKIYEELINRKQKIIDSIQEEQRELASLEATLNHNEAELEKRTSELEAAKEKISSVCDYTNFDEALMLQSKKVQDLQDKRGLYTYRRTAYKEYIKQLKESDPCCPLCHRNFNASHKAENLITELENDIAEQPEMLKRYELKLKEQREKYDSMLQLIPVFEQMAQLENIELPKLRKNLEITEQRVQQLQASIRKKERLRENLEAKLNMFKEVFNDINIWDRCINDISESQELIRTLEERMAETGIKSFRPIIEAQKQKDSLRASIKSFRDRVDDLQFKLNSFNEELQRAREKRNALFEEQLKIQSNMQKLQELRNKQTELDSRQVTLESSVRKLKDELTDKSDELEIAVRELEKLKKQHLEKEENDRTIITEAARCLYELNSIQDEINAFEYRSIPTALEKLQSEIQNHEIMIDTHSRKKEELEKSIKDTKDEINRQEIRKRDLSDNLALRKLQMSAQEIEEKSAEIVDKIKNMNYEKQLEQARKLKAQEETLHRKKNIALGKREELEASVLQYMNELQKETYRLARKNYMDKCIELTVQSETISNIKVYSKVLDAAMIKYHEERIKTINRIMKHLWKIIYTGNDTSYIEIRANATAGVGKSRRSYNYKLVQVKHGKEMDMRGRCSAGQKVLASIILRLALAETFCKDCGVIALDEPTTNLDEDHANTLADALNLIVKVRSQRQKNFQLIVISHDEKFLRKLAQANHTLGYYELYRKENGVTSIKLNTMGTDPFVGYFIKEESSSSEDEVEDGNSRKRISKDCYYDVPMKKRFICNL